MSTALLEPCGHPGLPPANGKGCELEAGHRGSHVAHADNGIRVSWPNMIRLPNGTYRSEPT